MESRENIVSIWSSIAEDNKNDLRKWISFLPKLRKDTPCFRQQILAALYKDENKAIDLIANIDALASLPVLIEILKNIKVYNDKALNDVLKNIGIQPVVTPVVINKFTTENQTVIEETLPDYFTPVEKMNIGEIFEDFIFKKNPERINLEVAKSQLSEKVVTNKIDSLIQSYLQKLIAANPSKKAKIEEHKAEIIQHLRIEIFTFCSIQAFVGADDAQKMYKFLDKVAFWNKYSPVELRKPFMAMAYLLKDIDVPEAVNEPWHELRVYLKGFYERVYRRLPNKDAHGVVQRYTDGTYPTILNDKQDAELKKNFGGLTKYDMALYYLVLCEMLEKKLKPLNTIPHLFHVKKVEHKKVIRPHDQTYLPKRLSLFVQQDPNNTAGKLDYFRRFIVDAPFTEEEINKLKDVNKEVRDACQDYTQYNNSWTLYLTEGKTVRDHTDEADQLVKLSYERDPQQLLDEVFKARARLIKKGSDKLLHGLEAVLVKAFNTILKGVPLANEAKLVNNRSMR